MDKVIKWLFQSSATGATHLQIIILSVVMLLLINALIKEFSQLILVFKEGCDSCDSIK